jgi:hypothetical protein
MHIPNTSATLYLLISIKRHAPVFWNTEALLMCGVGDIATVAEDEWLSARTLANFCMFSISDQLSDEVDYRCVL